MADDHDRLLDAAFADFTAATAPHVKPAGMDPVRATVRHRRTVRITAASFIAVIAVIAPVAAFAARDHGDSGPPVPGGSSPAAIGSASPPAGPSSAPPSDTPSAQESSAPQTQSPPSVAAGAPPNRSVPVDCAHPTGGGPVSMADLCNGTFDMPASDHNGNCPDGPATFKAGTSGYTKLVRVVQTDVDHDGQAETVALYNCGGSDPGTQAVVVFTRTGGSIRALGDFATYGEAPGAISWVSDLGAGNAGDVWLHVGNLKGSDGASFVEEVQQWRGYRWDGRAFVQYAGSTSFTTPDRGVTVTNATMRLLPASGGVRPVTLTVTVHNGGGATVADVTVTVFANFELTAPKGDCPVVTVEYSDAKANRCSAGSLAAGATKTFTLRYELEESQAGGLAGNGSPGAGFVLLRLGDQQAAKKTIPSATA
ncbi:hypothetical protein [Dactylosporangium sp. NPDC048998]|uniref:hypothetical protein n=1 Tax=Dactylosporangium sp. NPDC048998 TaxID=3363976 RepID=UPI00371AA657